MQRSQLEGPVGEGDGVLGPQGPRAPVGPRIRVFFSESALHIRWPKYWSSSFSISPSNEYSGLISFKTDWFDLLAVQGHPGTPLPAVVHAVPWPEMLPL